jgi:hypothetical protein
MRAVGGFRMPLRRISSFSIATVLALWSTVCAASVPPLPPSLPAGTPSQALGYDSYYLYVLEVHWAREQLRRAIIETMEESEVAEAPASDPMVAYRNGPPRLVYIYKDYAAGFPTDIVAFDEICRKDSPSEQSANCNWRMRIAEFKKREAYEHTNNLGLDNLSTWLIRAFNPTTLATYAQSRDLKPRGNEMLNEWYFFGNAHAGHDLSFLGDLKGHARANWINFVTYDATCLILANQIVQLQNDFKPLLENPDDVVTNQEGSGYSALGYATVILRLKNSDKTKVVRSDGDGFGGLTGRVGKSIKEIRDQCTPVPAPSDRPS